MSQPSPEHRLLIELCLQLEVAFLWFGHGLLIIDRKGLACVLATLDKQAAEVVGLDGFELDGRDVHPRLDLIYDSARLPGFPSPAEVIQTWPEDVWVDVTIGHGP